MNKHINPNRSPPKERHFLGKVKDFISKEEQRSEQKHLKAYILGKEFYKDGYVMEVNPVTNLKQRVPNLIKVKQL